MSSTPIILKGLGAIGGLAVLQEAAHAMSDIDLGEKTKGKLKSRLLKNHPELKKLKVDVKEEAPTAIIISGDSDSFLSALLAGKPKYTLRSTPDASDAAIAHEAGHIATDTLLGRPWRAAHLVSRNLSNATYLPALLAGTLGDSTIPTIHLAISAPSLVDEALASTHALQHLVSAKGLSQGLKEALPLVPAMGTYVLHASGPHIAKKIVG